MKSRTSAQFRKAFAGLPAQVQEQTREAYRQFKRDPSHPSLRFKKVHPELPIYSARISKVPKTNIFGSPGHVRTQGARYEWKPTLWQFEP